MPPRKRPASAAGPAPFEVVAPMPVKKKPATPGRTCADPAAEHTWPHLRLPLRATLLAEACYVVSFGQQCFLDTNRGRKVQVWRDGELHPGDDPTAVQWQFIPVGPKEENNTFLIRNKKYQSYLDAGDSNYYLHCSMPAPRADDLMKMWVIQEVPHWNSFYIVSKGKGKFLNTNGVRDGCVVGQAQLWGDGVYPGSCPWNLQWQLVAA